MYTYLFQAWYRRGKANASLGNYEDAVRDLTVAMKMELALVEKRKIESELKLYRDRKEERNGLLDCASDMNFISAGIRHTCSTFFLFFFCVLFDNYKKSHEQCFLFFVGFDFLKCGMVDTYKTLKCQYYWILLSISMIIAVISSN